MIKNPVHVQRKVYETSHDFFSSNLLTEPHSAHPSAEDIGAKLEKITKNTIKVGRRNLQQVGPCPQGLLSVPQVTRWYKHLVPYEIARVQRFYDDLSFSGSGVLPVAKRRIEAIAARIRDGFGLSDTEQNGAIKLYDALKGTIEFVKSDLELMQARTFDAQSASMVLRVDDINEGCGTFNYTRDDVLRVDNLFAAGHGRIESRNAVQFAKLQQIVWEYTTDLHNTRVLRMQPRLTELTALHKKLSSVLVGRQNLLDRWPNRDLYRAPPPPDSYEMAESRPRAFASYRDGGDMRFGNGDNVYAFIDHAEQFCTPEVDRLGTKLRVCGMHAASILNAVGKVFAAPRTGYLDVRSADKISRDAKELGVNIVELRKDRKTIRYLAQRLKETLDNRVKAGNVPNVFAPFGVLLTPDEGARAYAYNYYAVLYGQLEMLDGMYGARLRMLTNIDNDIRRQLKKSISPVWRGAMQSRVHTREVMLRVKEETAALSGVKLRRVAPTRWPQA